MNAAYDASAWSTFFAAEVGGSAALVGLLFVAVSINIRQILEAPRLPGLAFEALIVLGMVLFIATFGLVPGQTTTTLGAEILGVAVVVWIASVVIQRRAPQGPNDPLSWTLSRVISIQLAVLPMIAAGVSLLLGRGGGLYWVVAGVLLSFLAAILNAWVLLVEILR